MLCFQAYVQDYSNFLSNQFVRVLICDDKEELFKGISAENILKKKDAQDKMKEILKNLLKFNVWVEAGIEINENNYLILRDTQIKQF